MTTTVDRPSRTGWIFDERFLWHDTGSGAGSLNAGGYVEPGVHTENPASKRRLRNLVDVSGLGRKLTSIPPRSATVEALYRLHDPAYVASIERRSLGRGGEAGERAPFGPGSYEIARLAVGACEVAVEAVISGRVRNAYALVRPPGHHAERERGRGFCLFANVALAALFARNDLDVERIAIVDWDVHHGNGTQGAFWDDRSTLVISVHQAHLFPHDSGNIDELGGEDAEGLNINVPMPPGSGEGAYVAAFESVVEPVVAGFGPDLILVACGFDASALDPLGCMMLRSHSFRIVAERIVALAEEHCDGRLVLCHEGGYSDAYVPFCGLAVLEALSGIRTAVEDPYFPVGRRFAYDETQEHQAAVISSVCERLGIAGLA